MRNLFTNQSLAGMTYYVLSMTTKNGGKFPRGIYNFGCKLPIIPMVWYLPMVAHLMSVRL